MQLIKTRLKNKGKQMQKKKNNNDIEELTITNRKSLDTF